LAAARAADRLFARYLSADYLFHVRRGPSAAIHEVARSTQVAYQLLAAPALNIVIECAVVTALVVVLTLVAPPPALLAAAVVLAVAGVLLIATRRLWARCGALLKTLEEQQLHVLHQSLGAFKEVKLTGREAFFEARLRAVRRELAAVQARRAVLAAALRLGVETTLVMAMLLVVGLVTRGGGSSADTVSLLGLFAYVGFRVLPSANRIIQNTGMMREGRAFVRGAVEDFRALGSELPRPSGYERPASFHEALVFEDVGFSYEPDRPPALSHVHLRIVPGESIGIVGATGAGKSTLVALLLGLLQPTSGRILLDGEPLAGRERAWQRLVGYVPQEPYLLDDTIRANIAFGVPESLVDEQRLRRAVGLAQLDDLIRDLPEGLDTRVGERGVRLSGGQRQRIAIARSLYGDPPVLVFDEATSALDPQAEREVAAALGALHGTRTLIVIAHRLSTVQRCDRLIFLENGRIAATGGYDALLRNAAFRAMVALP
jgi:ATP-binding cassette subfamily C protein